MICTSTPSQPLITPSTITYRIITVKRGDTFHKIFGKEWELVSRYLRTDEKHLVADTKIKIPADLETLKNWTPMPRKYSPALGNGKYILVSLKDQYLGAYVFGKLIFDMPISSGRPKNRCDSASGDCSTPQGIFRVLGGDKNHISSLYDDPSGNPYPMLWAVRFYVTKAGTQYWIHGGDLPGYPASHGCVRVMPKDGERMFQWLFPTAPETDFWLKKDTDTPVEIK